MSEVTAGGRRWRRPVQAACAGTVLVAAGIVGGAQLVSAADEDATVYACVKSNGDVRLVAAGETCKKDERSTSWSVRGPVGPVGPQGPQGETGPQGPAGADGGGSAGGGGGATQVPVGYLSLTGTQPAQGDATAAGFENQIEVLAYSWGASSSGTATGGAGGGAGKVNLQDISLTKPTDSATIALLQSVASGRFFASGVLSVCEVAPCTPANATRYELRDVLVTSMSVGASGAQPHTESATLGFGRVTVTRPAQGGAPQVFTYDTRGATSP